MLIAAFWLLATPATQPTPLPVRQTAHLKITPADVADLPAYLARDVPMGDIDPTFRPTLVNDKNEERVPVTAQQWLDARKAGFSWKANVDNKLEGAYKRYAFPAQWLRDAKPSQRSFLGGVRTDARIVDWLPASFGFSYDAESAEAFEKKRHHPPVWRDMFPATLIADRQRDRITLDDTHGGQTVITLLAYGDVNADGIQDVLAEVATHATGGTFSTVSYVTFTRTSEAKSVEVLWVWN